jgi:argininosuccinate lyase
VREGVPFREAHEAVGKIVGHCTREGVDLRSLSLEEMRSFNAAFPAAASELLDLDRSLEQRTLLGGTASETVRGALAQASARLEEEGKALVASAGAGQ